MTDIVDAHYRRLANRYDEFLLYSPDFVRALTSKMIEMLELQPDEVLVDLGCGTGIYSSDILRQVPLKTEVVGVDPIEEMLKLIPPESGIRPVCQDALEFSREPNRFDKVLMKEAIHHVDDRRSLLAGLRQSLPRGGRILLVHVPPKVQYPLFRAALERCERWHADPDELEALMRELGYAVERDAVDYAHAIPRDSYLAMVENRYMSALSSFSDEELAAGLAEMRESYAEWPVLEFIDHFDFILGTRE
ncbi:MAG: class I SAM-dependent methyltransferase [Myxococcota bacterium]